MNTHSHWLVLPIFCKISKIVNWGKHWNTVETSLLTLHFKSILSQSVKIMFFKNFFPAATVLTESKNTVPSSTLEFPAIYEAA